MDCDIIIIGGGAAGLVAAGTAALSGKKVVLIEKNKIVGKKMLITGKGRCNITNDTDVQGIIKNIPTNGRFMHSALNAFDKDAMLELLDRYGVKTKVERGGRIFPTTDRAADVVSALNRYVLDSGAQIINGTVTKINIREAQIVGVTLDGGKTVECDSVIVATGGLSYPLTGSTGDGYSFAKAARHTVVEPKPSLVPLEVESYWLEMLQGLSLKNVEIKLYSGGKLEYSDFGEMLFTHFGLSGPIILSASSHMRGQKKYSISIDLKPALDEDKLDKRILRDFSQIKNRDFANSLGDLLPKAMIPVIIEMSGIAPTTKVHSVTKEQRTTLVRLIKNFSFNIKGFRSIREAVITSGGVKVAEINPKTMESKLVRGLYFAGEVIDVDGYTGGFNLQIAFSTGYLAGASASQEALGN